MLDQTLAQSLGAWTLRQEVLANDVANANTSGFEAQDVSFGKTLQGAMTAAVVHAPGLMDASGNGVDLAASLAQLEQTSVHLAGVEQILSTQFTATQQAITSLESA